MIDKKKIFAVLNILQGVLVGAIPLIVSSRISAVNLLLFITAALMIAAGPALLLGGRIGSGLATLACLVHGALGTVFAALIVSSASYLYGIYGRHGHSVGAMAFVIAAFVLIVFWLVPAHELHYLRKTRSEK